MQRAWDLEMSLSSDSSAGKEPGASGRVQVSESDTGAPSSLQALLTVILEAAESLPVCAASQLIFPHPRREHWCHPHFADEGTEAQRLSRLPKVVQWPGGNPGAQPQVA